VKLGKNTEHSVAGGRKNGVRGRCWGCSRALQGCAGASAGSQTPVADSRAAELFMERNNSVPRNLAWRTPRFPGMAGI